MDLPPRSKRREWACNGGLEHWIQTRAKSDVAPDLSRFQTILSESDLEPAVSLLLEKLDLLLPAEPYWDDEEGLEELKAWQEQCRALRGPWSEALHELARQSEADAQHKDDSGLLGSPSVSRPAISASQRDQELDAALARYLLDLTAPACEDLDGYASYSIETDDAIAARLRETVLTQAVERALFSHARPVLDKLHVLKADTTTTEPIEAFKSRWGWQRAKIHQYALRMGLFTQSRDDAGRSMWAQEARKKAEESGKSGNQIKKTILVSRVAFSESPPAPLASLPPSRPRQSYWHSGSRSTALSEPGWRSGPVPAAVS